MLGAINNKIINDIEEFLKIINGRISIIYGKPRVGKTTFTLLISKKFENPLYIRIDKNIDIDTIKKLNPKITIYDLNLEYPYSLRYLLDTILGNREYQNLSPNIRKYLEQYKKDYDLIIIDSLSNIKPIFVDEFNPNKELKYRNFLDHIGLKLEQIKERKNISSIIICHESLRDFENKEIGPRLPEIFERHIDAIFKLEENNGKRYLLLEFIRNWDDIELESFFGR